VIQLLAGSGNDIIIGGNDADMLYGNEGSDIFIAKDGEILEDIIDGGDQSDESAGDNRY